MGQNYGDFNRGGRDNRNRYTRDDYQKPFHPNNRGGGRRDDNQDYYRDQDVNRQGYDNQRDAPMVSQREQVSFNTGIPKDLLKSDLATNPGVSYQAKPSEIRYHFYIICLNCKNLPVQKVKDYICEELAKLGFKVSKEAIYIDDKEYEKDFKALVGLKFDHKALQCFDNSNRMKFPFRFRTELSRTFAAYMEKYGDAIRTMAYPSDPMMCPNQKIEKGRGKNKFL